MRRVFAGCVARCDVACAAIVILGALNLVAFRIPWIPDLPDSQYALGARLAELSVLIGLFQSIALWLAFRCFQSRRRRNVLIVAMSFALGISLWAAFENAPQSNDVYAYIGYAKQPDVHHAYATTDTPLPASFAKVNRVWGKPLVPSAYGPVWVAYDRALLASSVDIPDAVFRTRFSNTCFLAAIAATLYLLRVPAITIWLFSINPLVWNNFVLSAHNDVIPVFLTCAAVLAVGLGAPLIGVVLVTAAGLCKITFALVGLVAFAGMPRPAARIALSSMTLALVVAGSWVLGGGAYRNALTYVAHMHQLRSTLPGIAVHYTLAALAAAAVVAALVRRAWLRAAVWSFPSLSVSYYSWYTLWGLPFALTSRSYTVRFLISLPVIGALIFAPIGPLVGAASLAAICLVFALAEIVRSRKPALPQHVPCAEHAASQ